MITSQRIVLISFMIGFIISISFQMYYQPRTYTGNSISDQEQQIIKMNTELKQEDSIIGSAKSIVRGQYEPTPLSNIIWSETIIKSLFFTAIPIMPKIDYQSTMEQQMNIILSIFRAILAMIMWLEAWFIFKNKKVT